MTAVFSDFPLDEKILQALEKCKYQHPTPIQEKSIPQILNHRDIIACAQTGTGKTAAFVLPILQKLTQASEHAKKPRILILTPTRELAAQINQAIRTYSVLMRVKLTSLVGGAGYREQIRDLSNPNLDIIVATPGRLMDHLDNRKVDLSGIETLVLDEADRMLDMGFIDAVLSIAKKTPRNRQTLLFSATIDERLSGITQKLLKDPVQIHIKAETKAPALITQELYLVNDDAHKMALLKHFLDKESIFKAVIFSATKINADHLARELNALGFKAKALHGDLNQSRRNQALELFSSGKVQYLIATDLAARGINVNDVTHVFNYDLPKFSDDYVHRIGRTGRAGKTGKAISFALSSDVRNIARIERFIKTKLVRSTVEGLEPKANIEKMGAASKASKSDRFSDRFKSSGSSRGKSFSRERAPSKSYGKSSENGEKSFSRRGSSESGRGRSFKSDFRREDSPFASRDRRPSSDFGDRRDSARTGDSFKPSRSKPFASRDRSDSDFGNRRDSERTGDSFKSARSKPFASRDRGDSKPFASRDRNDSGFGNRRDSERTGDSFKPSRSKPFASRDRNDSDFGNRRDSARTGDSFKSARSKPFASRDRNDSKPFASRDRNDFDFGNRRDSARTGDSFKSAKPRREFKRSDEGSREFSSQDTRSFRPKSRSSSERNSETGNRGNRFDERSSSRPQRRSHGGDRDIFAPEKKSPRSQSDSWQTRGKERTYRSESSDRDSNVVREKPSQAYSRGRFTEESKVVEVSYKKNRSGKKSDGDRRRRS